jgi:predicted transcriptional regulator of viral defense system
MSAIRIQRLRKSAICAVLCSQRTPRDSAADFLDQMARAGRYHFATDGVASELGRSLPVTRAALLRLAKQGRIAQPSRGFYVIVPPEYRKPGCLPAAQFVPQLFDHLGESYYAALLTAAELHGAAHQRPQRFQVMCATRRRPIQCGAVHVEFMLRKDLYRTATVQKNTPRGTLRIASREATALELVGYADRCGGLDHVVTVLEELGPECNGKLLAAEADKGPIAWSQRLGYLLDLLDIADAVTSPMAAKISERRPVYAALSRSLKRTGAPSNRRWRLAVNVELEAPP